MARLDSYDKIPPAMAQYLSNYGWHFNKKLAQWASSIMKKQGGASITPHDKERVEAILKQYGIDIPANKIYDAVYLMNMARADYMGSSITDEQHLAKFVQDYINDPDGYDEVALTRFYADCIGKGIGIQWDDML